jgi:hypothetical protein
MSVGNLKDYGNKGNNFPFQLKTLQGLAMPQYRNLRTLYLFDNNPSTLESLINAEFANAPNSYLVSQNVFFDGSTNTFAAFITFATL